MDSSGPLDSLSLHHLASDVATIIDQLDLGKAVIVGKAFGNRVARCVAADYPKLINAVVLISAGGLVPASSEVLVPEYGRILKKQLGDRAELVEISDAGHFLHLEKSEEVLESIIDYLKKMN